MLPYLHQCCTYLSFDGMLIRLENVAPWTYEGLNPCRQHNSVGGRGLERLEDWDYLSTLPARWSLCWVRVLRRVRVYPSVSRSFPVPHLFCHHHHLCPLPPHVLPDLLSASLRSSEDGTTAITPVSFTQRLFTVCTPTLLLFSPPTFHGIPRPKLGGGGSLGMCLSTRFLPRT